MRIHITLPDRTVELLDHRVGPRGRSRFVQAAIAQALDDEQRWDDIEAALGAIEGSGHDWDGDPARWVRDQRASDLRRRG